MGSRYQTIIVGAGAAGIACARRLFEKNHDFLLIEARGRIGGRVLSRSDSLDHLPIELGAEFIHDPKSELTQWLRELEIPFYDVKDEHFLRRGRKLEEFARFWEEIGSVMGRLNPKRDMSIHEFLEKKKKKMNSETFSLFSAFVEGFHGADLNLIGEAGLASTEESGDEGLNEAKLFRPVGRYDRVLQRMLAPMASSKHLSFNTAMRSIHWRRGKVRLECETGPTLSPVEFECRKIVVTVPLGVLKGTGLDWEPEPLGLREALENLHMGHVQRIVFRFRSRFWEKLSKKPIVFMHAGPESFFPTWWNYQPLRSPHLIAWQGGPKAQKLSMLPAKHRAALALRSLAKLTSMPLNEINAGVVSWHTHNWTLDKHALGAYSYVGKGGMSGASRLRKPFMDTIYFAGEATAEGPSRGTVHGAIESGYRAAHQILRS